MTFRFNRAFLLLLLLPLSARAQEVLTLQDAITKALQQNYDIRISSVVAQQAAANNTLGNAGLLPNVNGTAGTSYSTLNTRQQFVDGRENNRTGAQTLAYNSGINADYTVFAGGRAFLIKRQLEKGEEIGEAQLKAQLQTSVSQVIQAYAQVVLNQQQQIATDTAIALSKVRMDLSRAKWEIGTSAKVDYLQAQVDYNASRSTRLTLEAALATARANLNTLMGEEPGQAYLVQDSLPLDMALRPTDKENLKSRNLLLDVARRSAETARIETRIARTYRMPSVTASAGYGYNRSRSDAGLLLFNQGFGPTGNLNLNLPIFQGGNIRRQIRIANLQEEVENLAYERLSAQLTNEYEGLWQGYQSAVSDYRLARESIVAAKENLDIQKARFRVGIATTLEIREAENGYVQALDRLNDAAYNVKVNETRVLELESRLVQ